MPLAYDPASRVQRREYQQKLLDATKRNRQPDGKNLVQVATGGGKTLIISDFARWCGRKGLKVLVVTKDWELLGQIAGDLARRHSDGLSLIGYVGKTPMAKRLFKGAHAGWGASVTFTTIQSWNHQKEAPKPDVVIIDELHWGEGAPLYNKLLTHCQGGYFLGFTATPRRWTSFRRIGKAYDFGALVKAGILASPIIEEPVQTGTHWAPERVGDHGDLTPQSLDQLASNPDRNAKIAETYVFNKAKYGKTILFACHVAHAKTLVDNFTNLGVKAACVHHQMNAKERRVVLDAFQEGEIEVLINVTMLTHGVDVPDIKTVFLTRPTLSDILFSQMVGRGARKTETKDTFYVVDFVDIVDKYGLPLVRPYGFFGNASVKPHVRGTPRETHLYVPAEFITFPHVEGYEDIEGLDIHPNQTFGIEFELETPSQQGTHLDYWTKALLEGLQGTVPTHNHRGWRQSLDYRVWNVVRDGSCGLEVVSRILRGSEGFVEVMDATRRLREVAQQQGLRVTRATGTHTHLAYPDDPLYLRQVALITAYYEPALFSLVSPSRMDNDYTQSLRPLVESRKQLRSYDRYRTVNFESLMNGGKTLEIRMHNGTVNGAKILTWVSLWMRVLERARKRVNLPRKYSPVSNGHLFSGGQEADVRSLATFVEASPILMYRLLARRDQLGHQYWHSKMPAELRQEWWENLFTAYVDTVAAGGPV